VGPEPRGTMGAILKHCSWPKEVAGAEELGLVADLQCGGRSTCILNDAGCVFVVGELSGGVSTSTRLSSFQSKFREHLGVAYILKPTLPMPLRRIQRV